MNEGMGATPGDKYRVKREYDRFALEYDGYYSGDIVRMEDNLIVGMLHPFTVGRDVLDLGCGTARYADRVSYTSYHGIDLSEKMVGLAPKDQMTTYTVSDWREADIESGGYGCVMNTFLGGSYAPIEALWDITTEALEPGGVFWHMIPTPEVGDRESYPMFDDPEDLYRYRRIEVAESVPDSCEVLSHINFQPVDGTAPHLTERDVNDYCYSIIAGEYHA